ncbi:MAG: MotA/TolQ/ExbB proton channel family protein [Verrucomicrobia bacterium]|nr:MAG: MotA/TolQ/ExbB proton channel family protein [Verrucomicrobiota bacterium]TAE87346.1 MAG: MotA/TolQ/ExbB proton channel family protein [Verrucomicrobiota bacterium]TAF25201.1 MAG: MotA/TolQ/ExbB proton channel family protein [Verrucomicrobiota bacterium]TAF40847.1 MAG: MotA/TolQ/ExbB proton channel family protein [Verrucomicrobiota bacterium]
MKRIPKFPVAFLLATASAHAAGEEAAAAERPIDLMQIFNDGGIMMYPLALLSLAAVVMILLFLLTIRRNAVVSDRFMNNAEALIRKRDFLGLVAYCNRQNECMARIAQKSLEFMTKNSAATFSDVREVAEAEGSRQVGMLSSRITYLADVGSVAPMVGLLGTVLGMIKSFINISTGGFEGARQMKLADGVSEALITTAAGLMVGIPALVFYSIFRGRVQKYIAELEAASTHFMATLHSQIQRQASPAQSQPASRREDFALPVHSPLSDDRPDLHGI